MCAADIAFTNLESGACRTTSYPRRRFPVTASPSNTDTFRRKAPMNDVSAKIPALTPGFWAIVAEAERDRSRMRVLLEGMSREQMIDFHRQFFDAAMAVATPAHVSHMAPGTSEDGADDISRWVVAQGRDYYLEVLYHPEKTPAEVEPHSPAQIFYEIPRVFIQRFGEDIWDADEDE